MFLQLRSGLLLQPNSCLFKLTENVGLPAVGGLKFSMAQKSAKSASLGKCQLEDKGHLGDKNLTLGRTIFSYFVPRKSNWNFPPTGPRLGLKFPKCRHTENVHWNVKTFSRA